MLTIWFLCPMIQSFRSEFILTYVLTRTWKRYLRPSSPGTADAQQLVLLELTLTEADVAKVAMARHLQSHGAPLAAAELVIEVLYSHVNPGKLHGLQRLMFQYLGNETALVRRIAHKYSVDLVSSFPGLAF